MRHFVFANGERIGSKERILPTSPGGKCPTDIGTRYIRLSPYVRVTPDEMTIRCIKQQCDKN